MRSGRPWAASSNASMRSMTGCMNPGCPTHQTDVTIEDIGLAHLADHGRPIVVDALAKAETDRDAGIAKAIPATISIGDSC